MTWHNSFVSGSVFVCRPVQSFRQRDQSKVLDPHQPFSDVRIIFLFDINNILQNHLTSSFFHLPSSLESRRDFCSFNNLFYLFPMSFLLRDMRGNRWEEKNEISNDKGKYLMGSECSNEKALCVKENKTNDCNDKSCVWEWWLCVGGWARFGVEWQSTKLFQRALPRDFLRTSIRPSRYQSSVDN